MTAIRVSNLTKRFGSFTAVDRVNMHIPKQSVYGFIGPNGSGKTTAIRMMCGLLLPTEGKIEVLGMKIPQQTDLVRRQVGYMTQKFSLYSDLSVRRNMLFMARVMGVKRHEQSKRIATLLDRFNLSSFTNRKAGALSGGQKRRLALATAVIHRPKLLLLDEPTSEVDPNTRREFWDELFVMCEAGTTILVTTHLMDEAERCHNLAIINDGRKVGDGTPTELKKALIGRIYSVSGSEINTLRNTLKTAQEVLGVTQIGLFLRVVLAEGIKDGHQLIGSILRQIPEKHIEQVPPSIEDVFVMTTRENRENHV